MTRHHRGKKLNKRTVYSLGFGLILIAVVLTAFVVMSSPHETPALEETPHVNISVPLSPEVTTGAEGTHLVYTLETSRFADDGLALVKLRVLDKDTGKELLNLEGTSLNRALELVSPTQTDSAEPNSSGNLTDPRIPITLNLPASDLPHTITHQLTFTSKTKAALPFTISGGEYRVPSSTR